MFGNNYSFKFLFNNYMNFVSLIIGLIIFLTIYKYMGNLFSNNHSSEYTKIKTEFDEYRANIDKIIYEKIDQNNDGVVTREEFSEWKNKYKKKMEKLIKDSENTIKDQFRETIVAKDAQIQELKRKLHMSEKAYAELEHQNINLIENTDNISSEDIKSIISKTKIRKYVNEIIENEDINIKGLPDSIEKAIYRNVMHIVLILIDKIAQQATFDVFGHEMRVIIK